MYDTMSRLPEAGQPADHVLSVRVNPKMLTWLDDHRGSLSRGRYIRTLIRAEANRTQDQRQDQRRTR